MVDESTPPKKRRGRKKKPPEEKEKDYLLDLLEELREWYGGNEEDAWESLIRGD